MKKTKRELNMFLSFDYEGLEKHLEEMAQKGWRLTKKSTPRILHYERIEPRKLHAAVVCLRSISEFTPLPDRKQDELIAYCKEAGWDFAAAYAQVHIFYSEQEHPVFPETDEAIRLKAVHRSMRNEFLAWGFIVFAGSWLIWDGIKACLDMPTRWALNLQWLVFLLWGLLITDAFSRFIMYFYWYLRSWYHVKHGKQCRKFAARAWRIFEYTILGIAVAASASVFLFDRNQGWVRGKSGIWIIVYLSLYALILYLVIGGSRKLRKAGVPGWINLAGTILIAVLAVSVLQYILVTKIERPKQNADGMPLRVEHISKETDETYYEHWDENTSFAAYAGTGWQRDETGDQVLYYVIMDVKYKPIYDLCLKRWLKAGEWTRIDETVWGVDAAYEQNLTKRGAYLVEDGLKLLYLVYERPLSNDELAAAVQCCLRK